MKSKIKNSKRVWLSLNILFILLVSFSYAQAAQEHSDKGSASYVLQANNWKLSVDDFEGQYIQPFLACDGKRPRMIISKSTPEELYQLRRCILNDILLIQSLAQIARDKNVKAKKNIANDLAEYKKTKKLPEGVDTLMNVCRAPIFAMIKEEPGRAKYLCGLYLYNDACQKEIFAATDAESLFLAAKIVSQVQMECAITDADLLDFYNKNLEKFRMPAEYRYRISEIVAPTEAQAKEIYAQLIQGGDFSALVKKYSTVSTKYTGGDLGWKTCLPESSEKLCQVANTLGKGVFSNIFKMESGDFAIIKLEDKDKFGGKVPTFEDIKDDIREVLEIPKIQLHIEKMLKVFQAKAHIVRNESILSRKDTK